MGTVESDISKHFGYLSSRVFGAWLAQITQLEGDVLFYLGILIVGVLIYLILAAMEAGHKEAPQAAPAPNKPSKSTYSAVISSYDEMRKRLLIDAPKGLRIPLGIAVAFLLCGIVGDWAYDFFVLLRIDVFTTCVIVLSAIWKAERSNHWLGVLLAIVVLYNPLLPIHLHKETWSWLNGLTFLVLGVLSVALTPTKPHAASLPQST